MDVKTYPVWALVALGLVLTGFGCDWVAPANETEEVRAVYPLDGEKRLWVETFNGAVEVRGADRADVEMVAVKRAVSREALGAIDVEVTEMPEGLRIRASRSSGYRGPAGVDLTLEVPRDAALDMVQSSNGRVYVSGVRGPARLRTSNGSVEAERTGQLEIRTSNGRIDVRDVAGPVEATT
ncbi:MAG: hypothetical protein H5T84_05850, partial [Thermoleophilia bacterium]|nr:hypothetical protein [Thermoleophilia bacterium]